MPSFMPRSPGKALFKFVNNSGPLVRTRGFATFDRKIFKKNWDKINESPLKRAGLLTRKIWIQSIRVDRSKLQNRPSKPGKPPRSRHPARPFKRVFSVPVKGNLFKNPNVIVGHVGFNPGNQTPMEIHEFGQSIRSKTIPIKQRSRRANGRFISRRQRLAARRLFQQGIIRRKNQIPVVERRVKMPKRPHATPALEKAQSRLPSLWRRSITKSTVKN